MKKITLLVTLPLCFIITACQTSPRQYNGITGYQIENKSAQSATIAYTLALRANQSIDENKLQMACQQVLGTGKTYKISVLSANEIPNPAATQQDNYDIQLGQSRASFSLSDTPSLNNSEDYATRQALEAKPATLRVIRYTCS